MRSNRGARNSSGGIGDLHHAAIRSSAGGRDTYTSRVKTTKLIESAKHDLSSLTEVVTHLVLYSEKLQTEAFNVIFQHLQTPVEQQLCEKEDPYDWIMESIVGINNLGIISYFELDDVHRERYIKSWPHIFKWLKVLLVVRHVYDESSRYSSVAEEAFSISSSVVPSILDDAEVLEFSVRAWGGVKTIDDNDCYTGQPLLYCLMALYRKGDRDGFAFRMECALLACGTSARDMVNKLITRLKHIMVGLSDISKAKALNLVNIMSHLVICQRDFFTSATLRPSVGGFLTSYLTAVVDDPNLKTEKEDIVYALLITLTVSLLSKPVNYAITLIRGSILFPILELASTASDSNSDSMPTDKPTSISLITSFVKQLLLCLNFENVVRSSQEALYSMYNGGMMVEDLVATSPRIFQIAWKLFETMLLEHIVLSYLLEGGLAPEDGICANSTCKKVKVKLRGEFQKCAGCMFALYCSRSYQKADWTSHKVGCMNMDNISKPIMHDCENRYARKVAALQINRFWEQILALANEKNIFLGDIVVRIDHLGIQSKLDVVDFKSFLEDNGEIPHLALAVREAQRQSEIDRRECVVVIIRMVGKEYPCLVHLDSRWTRNPTDAVLSKLRNESYESDGREPLPLADNQNKRLVCGRMDALRSGVQLAMQYAADFGETVWSESILRQAVGDVLEDFEDVIGSPGSGPVVEEQKLTSGELDSLDLLDRSDNVTYSNTH